MSLRSMLKRIPYAKKMAILVGYIPKDQRGRLLKKLPQNSIGAEIGVHEGDFSERILDMVHPKKLHLIDPWKYENSETYKEALYGGKTKKGQVTQDDKYEMVKNRFKSEIDSGRVEIHRGFSQDVSNSFPSEYFDWVYIDGNHLYEFVKKDLEFYFIKVKLGGYLTGDDYTDGGWWKGGVKKAVDEFVTNRAVELVEIKYSQFIIKKLDTVLS